MRVRKKLRRIKRLGYLGLLIGAVVALRKAKAIHHPPHVVAGTAANQVLELAGIGEWTA